MNVTYLFGAGASAGAIPLATEVASKMEQMAIKIKTEYPLHHEFSNNLDSFATEAKRHRTIDTYAKKLFVTDDDKFYRFKCILSTYFTLQQLELSGKIDSRYDSLWASIVSSGSNLPKSIKILTWNYDVQMELSFAEYCRNGKFQEAINRLNVVTNNESAYIGNVISDWFGVYKINGTANVFLKFPQNYTSLNHSADNIVNEYNHGIDNEILQKVIDQYHFLLDVKQHRQKPTLTFAWEHNVDRISGQGFIEKITPAISSTNVLVIIGYSFPFFNRQVDKQILDAMLNLETVYIQDPNTKGIEQSFEAIRGFSHNIEIIKLDEYKDQFYLPNELSL